jgi:hypothetical protein
MTWLADLIGNFRIKIDSTVPSPEREIVNFRGGRNVTLEVEDENQETNVTIHADVPDPEGANVALWVLTDAVDNDDYDHVFGYTAEQISTSYSGDPAVDLDTTGIGTSVGHGQGLSVLDDGTLVFSTSEGDGDDSGGESWWVVDQPARKSLLTASDVRRIRCDSFTDSNAHTGARGVLQLPDGSVALSREFFVQVQRASLKGVPGHSASPVSVVSPAHTGWDVHFDPSGDLVWSAAGDSIWAVSYADVVSDSGTATIVKELAGSNVSGSSDTDAGIGGIAFDASGGLWAFDSDAQTLKYWNAAAIAALTDSPSNTAPTRTLTSASFVEGWSVVLGRGGDAWVVLCDDPGKLLHFTAAQLATGGSQIPDRTLTIPYPGYPVYARFAFGHGVYLR